MNIQRDIEREDKEEEGKTLTDNEISTVCWRRQLLFLLKLPLSPH